MHALSRMTRVVVCLCLVTSAAVSAPPADLPGTGRDAGRTVVYRDTWGVPHIYAPTVEAGLFAMGWARPSGENHLRPGLACRGRGAGRHNAPTQKPVRKRSLNFLCSHLPIVQLGRAA